MRCNQVQSKLSAFHDNELGRSESEAVRGHLLQCQSCRDSAADLRMISRSLAPPAAVPALSVDFTDRVFARIQKDPEISTTTLFLVRTRVMRWVAVAAALVVGVSALYLAAPRSSDGTLNAASEREVEMRIHEMSGSSVLNETPAAAPSRRPNVDSARTSRPNPNRK